MVGARAVQTSLLSLCALLFWCCGFGLAAGGGGGEAECASAEADMEEMSALQKGLHDRELARETTETTTITRPPISELATDAYPGDTELQITNVSGFEVGDVIVVQDDSQLGEEREIFEISEDEEPQLVQYASDGSWFSDRKGKGRFKILPLKKKFLKVLHGLVRDLRKKLKKTTTTTTSTSTTTTTTTMTTSTTTTIPTTTTTTIATTTTTTIPTTPIPTTTTTTIATTTTTTIPTTPTPTTTTTTIATTTTTTIPTTPIPTTTTTTSMPTTTTTIATTTTTTTLSACELYLTENPDRGWRQVGLSGGPTKDLHLFPMVQVGDKTYLHGGVVQPPQGELQQAYAANVVFVYDWPSQSWSQIEYEERRRNSGLRQYGHVLVWTGEYLLAFGGARGRTAGGTGERYALVRWDLSGDSITQTLLPGDVDERTGTWPLHRAFMAGVWDTANKVMRIFGGALTLDSEIRVQDNRQLDELWEYDPLTATWTDLTATSKANSAEFPAARRLPNAFWDSIGNRTIVYGGISGAFLDPAFTIHEDLWAYSRSSNTWHQIVQNDPLPPARFAAQVAWTGAGLLVFGGLDTVGASTLDGWWEFSIASGTWQEIWPRDPGLRTAGLFVSTATAGGAATFEPCRKAMLMHGGGTFYFFAAPTSLGTVEFGLGVDA